MVTSKQNKSIYIKSVNRVHKLHKLKLYLNVLSKKPKKILIYFLIVCTI